jgi:hypothetical protein
MIANGVESYPAVSGERIPGWSGQLKIATDDASLAPILVSWSGSYYDQEGTVDLSALPSGWLVWVGAGCDPASPNCGSVGDEYTTGLEGTLTVEQVTSRLVQVTTCLHLRESPGSPHLLLHALDLYVPPMVVAPLP